MVPQITLSPELEAQLDSTTPAQIAERLGNMLSQLSLSYSDHYINQRLLIRLVNLAESQNGNDNDRPTVGQENTNHSDI